MFVGLEGFGAGVCMYVLDSVVNAEYVRVCVVCAVARHTSWCCAVYCTLYHM